MNADRYIRVTSFTDALRNWSDKPLASIPSDIAPPGYLRGCDEENRKLADVFARLCALPTTTDRMGFLMAQIEMHKRHVRLAESTIRGERNPRLVGANASREAWSTLRPIEDMIDVLEQWRDELADRWSADIGIAFIDEVVRTRVAS